jgi:hypothetical protein
LANQRFLQSSTDRLYFWQFRHDGLDCGKKTMVKKAVDPKWVDRGLNT